MTVRIINGDCRDVLRSLPAESVNCCVTSPPYFGLRDYGVDGQIGLEPTPDEFVAAMVGVFTEVRRVLRDDGTVWLNLGDSYAGGGGFAPNAPSNLAGSKQTSQRGAKPGGVRTPPGLKPKDLIGIPWRVAFALQADGWWLRSAIVWHKPNPMPESVTDRPTSAYEMVFLLAKAERYYFDAEAVREAWADDRNGASGAKASKYEAEGAKRQDGGVTSAPQTSGRNIRNVWTIATQPFADAHFATMAPDLAERCIKAGCPAGGTVLDPFGGAGTTGLVADRLQRNAVLVELNPEYAAMAKRRIEREAGMFSEVISEAAE